MTRSVWIAGAAVLVLLSTPLQAQRQWLEVQSPGFVVLSEGDERAARGVAWQFEQVRLALNRVWPWAEAHADRPFLIFALRNQDAMKAMTPEFFKERGSTGYASYWVTAPERYYVALRADIIANDRVGRENPYQSAYWSYASIVLGRSLGRLPQWLSRGLAEVMSNTVVTDRSLQVGMMQVSALETLRDRGRLRLPEFLAVDRMSPWVNDPERLHAFDAQAGTFVHYLMFGNKGARREQLNRVIALLREGRPQDEALETFGDLQVLESEYTLYIRGQFFQYMTLPAETTVRRETFSLRRLNPAEAVSRRAAFHVAMGHEVEARALIAEASKLDLALPDVHELEGLLLDRARDTDAARQSYGRALEAGSSSYYVKYRWAALTWNRPDLDDAGQARVRQALEDAVTVNDRHAPAFGLLSDVRARLGAGPAALSAARTAAALEPDQAYYAMVLARALWNGGARDEARKTALAAVELARTENERRSIADLIAFMERASSPAPGAPAASSAATPSTGGAPMAARAPSPPANGTSFGQRCMDGDAVACNTIRSDAEQSCASTKSLIACSLMGHIYGRGLGVEKDLDRGIALFEQNCEAASFGDCHNAAALLLERRGPEDQPRAIKFLWRACDGGHAPACEAVKGQPR